MAGVKNGADIRLKGMGKRKGKNSGDLYLAVMIKEEKGLSGKYLES